MTRPRVLNVITRLIAGGAQENTLLACQSLKEHFDLTLVSGPPDGREGSLLEEAARRGVSVLLIPELVREISPAKDAAAFLKLEQLFQAERPQIVHTHSSKAGILGRWAAWAARVPVVLHTNHGLAFADRQSFARRALYWGLEKLCSPLSDRIVCVGEEMRRLALAARLGPPERFTVIYNGFEIERFERAASVRASLGIPEDVPVAGIVSRMIAHKGHRFLIDAAPPGVHLLLVGDGVEREALQRQAAARGVSATFTGHVATDAVPGLLASMDVLVHPSLWEGLPRAPLEAMFAGRPVVAFDCDGTREVVVDRVSGRLVPAGDVAALGAALAEVLSRPDRGRSLGEAGRRLFRDRFDQRAAGERIRALYEELLAAARGGGVLSPKS